MWFKRVQLIFFTNNTLYYKAFHILKSHSETTSFIQSSPISQFNNETFHLCRPSTVLLKYQCFPHLS